MLSIAQNQPGKMSKQPDVARIRGAHLIPELTKPATFPRPKCIAALGSRPAAIARLEYSKGVVQVSATMFAHASRLSLQLASFTDRLPSQADNFRHSRIAV